MNKQKQKQYIIGIDIGGTKTDIILFDGENILENYRFLTPKNKLDDFISELNEKISMLVKKANENGQKIKGIGVSVAGVLDSSRKKVLNSNNIKILNGVCLVDELKKLSGLPVEIDNDANCFLIAEMKKGVGQKYKNAYGIIIGTGIGGSLWLNGSIYRGFSGSGGEPGDLIIDFDEELTLEQAYHNLMGNNPTEFIDKVLSGDDSAKKNFMKIGDYLGITLSNIVDSVDPEVFIIGGGIAKFDDYFMPQLEDSMRQHIHSPQSKNAVKVIKGEIGKNVCAIGATMLL